MLKRLVLLQSWFGGSSATDQIEMAQVVKGIKKGIKIPIILFPGNVTGVVLMLMQSYSAH